MTEIIGMYLREKELVDPQSGEPLSKRKRLESMFKILTNDVYGVKYTKEDQLMAADLIKMIVNE